MSVQQDCCQMHSYRQKFYLSTEIKRRFFFFFKSLRNSQCAKVPLIVNGILKIYFILSFFKVTFWLVVALLTGWLKD